MENFIFSSQFRVKLKWRFSVRKFKFYWGVNDWAGGERRKQISCLQLHSFHSTLLGLILTTTKAFFFPFSPLFFLLCMDHITLKYMKWKFNRNKSQIVFFLCTDNNFKMSQKKNNFVLFSPSNRRSAKKISFSFKSEVRWTAISGKMLPLLVMKWFNDWPLSVKRNEWWTWSTSTLKCASTSCWF